MSRHGWCVLALAAVGACSGPPWYMGRPVAGGHGASIDDHTPSPSRLRSRLAQARVACQPALELHLLTSLEEHGTLNVLESARLVELLGQRSAQLAAADRRAPAARDAERATALAARFSSGLVPVETERRDRPQPCPGAAGADALTGALDDAAVGPRILALILAPNGEAPLPSDARGASAQRAWLVAQLLVEEDPTSGDAREAAALLASAAGRDAWADRMLSDQVFHSPDRPEALARAAGVWQRRGHLRRACARWRERTQLVASVGDESWDRLYACARRDPSIGDAEAVRRYVLHGTPTDAQVDRDLRLRRAAEASGPVSGGALRTAANGP